MIGRKRIDLALWLIGICWLSIAMQSCDSMDEPTQSGESALLDEISQNVCSTLSQEQQIVLQKFIDAGFNIDSTTTDAGPVMSTDEALAYLEDIKALDDSLNMVCKAAKSNPQRINMDVFKMGNEYRYSFTYSIFNGYFFKSKIQNSLYEYDLELFVNTSGAGNMELGEMKVHVNKDGKYCYYSVLLQAKLSVNIGVKVYRYLVYDVVFCSQLPTTYLLVWDNTRYI